MVQAIDTRAFRDVIGGFATGVTVITFSTDEVTRGMTANAVTSVSLDPTLVAVCVGKAGTAHPQLEVANAFAVNILAEDQADVSNTFSRGEVRDMAGQPYTTGATGSPLLEGVLAWLDCEVHARIDGGDHTIYIGKVVDLALPRPDAAPLLFFRGRYQALAKGV